MPAHKKPGKENGSNPPVAEKPETKRAPFGPDARSLLHEGTYARFGGAHEDHRRTWRLRTPPAAVLDPEAGTGEAMAALQNDTGVVRRRVDTLPEAFSVPVDEKHRLHAVVYPRSQLAALYDKAGQWLREHVYPKIKRS